MLVTVLVSLWFAVRAIDARERGGLWIVARVTLWILVGGPGEGGLSPAIILERLLMIGAGGLYIATMLALTTPLRQPGRRRPAEEPSAAV